MIRFFRTPWIVRSWYPNLTWRLPTERSIFITFDDGPDPEVTPWVLDELDKVNGKGTFFCEGRQLVKFPELALEITKRGHSIGNHGFNHLSGWSTPDEVYLNDIKACDTILNEIGVQSDLFRPPYGRIRKRQIHRLENKRIIMWTYVSYDFDSGVSPHNSIKLLKQAQTGHILVFHDSQKAFKNLQVILPEILTHFQEKGLKFEAIK
ncbi:Peptidoglycan/xylan/chitin deacetylase, PgdA/CDA1 family [Ekhidna lutea]|uniref:Peptidoglycan/xylan/chitin deacetylase, PgdA/CDA1 family n=1 Tax=Ekhidna lutea TaxID=447679 RepID=A0A239HIW5_EKHLU|nr:polysaccharide deacetylase family protein [Ekhidna lutea]SNS81260.1 Peptidoglycan/xylan/chitin deacetylase, PgdA/CDA1 family [Ekhidna lutea]